MCKTITLENSFIDISREHVKLKKTKKSTDSSKTHSTYVFLSNHWQKICH